MTTCRGCGAQESHCREVLPACRRIAADRQRIYAAAIVLTYVADEAAADQRRAIEYAVARATAPLRAEIVRIEAEVRRLQAEATVPGPRGRT